MMGAALVPVTLPRRLTNPLAILAAQVLLLLGLFFLGLGWGRLPWVDPSRPGPGIVERHEGVGPFDVIGPAWLGHMTLIAAAMVGCAGLPARRNDDRARAGAVSQAAGGVLAVVSMLAGLNIGGAFFFTGPGDDCIYPSCWPLYQQVAVLATPSVISGGVMVAAAVTVRRFPWWIRATGPAVLWLLLVIVQRVLWFDLLLPTFRTPPT